MDRTIPPDGIEQRVNAFDGDLKRALNGQARKKPPGPTESPASDINPPPADETPDHPEPEQYAQRKEEWFDGNGIEAERVAPRDALKNVSGRFWSGFSQVELWWLLLFIVFCLPAEFVAWALHYAQWLQVFDGTPRQALKLPLVGNAFRGTSNVELFSAALAFGTVFTMAAFAHCASRSVSILTNRSYLKSRFQQYTAHLWTAASLAAFCFLFHYESAAFVETMTASRVDGWGKAIPGKSEKEAWDTVMIWAGVNVLAGTATGIVLGKVLRK